MGSWCFAPINTIQLNSTLQKQADSTFTGLFQQVNCIVNMYFKKFSFQATNNDLILVKNQNHFHLLVFKGQP